MTTCLNGKDCVDRYIALRVYFCIRYVVSYEFIWYHQWIHLFTDRGGIY